MFLVGSLAPLHAGTSPVMSQTVLTLMFVVLGIMLVGVGYAYAGKSKESLKQHQWTLTVSLALALIPVFGVMIPTLITFYTDPDVLVLSSISITQIAHATVSVPALATAAVYALGKLPADVKRAMRWTVALWIASLVLGVVMFLQMMELIPSF